MTYLVILHRLVDQRDSKHRPLVLVQDTIGEVEVLNLLFVACIDQLHDLALVQARQGMDINVIYQHHLIFWMCV